MVAGRIGSGTIMAESIHTMVRFAAFDVRHHSGESMWQTVHRSKDAIALTVFIEDSPALIGVAVTFLGIGLGQVFHNGYFDPAASVVIELVLVGAGFTLARERRPEGKEAWTASKSCA